MNLSGVAKHMLRSIFISMIVLILTGIIGYRSITGVYFAIGVTLGCLLNALKVAMICHATERAVEMEPKKAVGYICAQYLLRFVITGIVLTVAALSPHVSLWGAAAGVFTMQIASLSTKFYKGDEQEANGLQEIKVTSDGFQR